MNDVLLIERLESRRLFAAVYPTAVEQYELELINRARANPTAEAARYSIALNEGLPNGTISTAAKQPLAINPLVTDAARKHSQWMIDHDQFSHYEGTADPGVRMRAAGYTFNAPWTWGENIGYRSQFPSVPDPATFAARVHQDLFVDAGIDGRGHRTNMMSNAFKEIGVGVVSGSFNGYNAVMVTTDFATSGTGSFLTGVAYTDNVTKDDLYTPGEGMSGVTVKAVRASDGATFTTTTWSSGGYSLKLSSGTYAVTGTGGELGTNVVAYPSVTIGSENVKRDFRPDQAQPVAATTGSIRGTVFSDDNHNGAQNSGETGLSGVLVYIDANKDGRRNSGEKYVRTIASGEYRFIKLANKTYRIRQVLPSGATLVAPSIGYHDVKITDAKRNVGGKNFADEMPTSAPRLSAFVFNPTKRLASLIEDSSEPLDVALP